MVDIVVEDLAKKTLWLLVERAEATGKTFEDIAREAIEAYVDSERKLPTRL